MKRVAICVKILLILICLLLTIIIDCVGAPVDKHSQCNQWAKRGDCLKLPRYMISNCAYSCMMEERRDISQSHSKAWSNAKEEANAWISVDAHRIEIRKSIASIENKLTSIGTQTPRSDVTLSQYLRGRSRPQSKADTVTSQKQHYLRNPKRSVKNSPSTREKLDGHHRLLLNEHVDGWISFEQIISEFLSLFIHGTSLKDG